MTVAPGAREALITAALRNTFRGDDESYEEYMELHRSEPSPYTNCTDFTCLHARAEADNALRALDAAGFDVVEASDAESK